MTGDLCLWRPGEEPSVTLHADAAGAVPERGAALEITGENRKGPTVSALDDLTSFIGTLVDVPADYDSTATFAAGEEVNDVTIRVTHYVEWIEADPGFTTTAGQRVVVGANGARGYSPAAPVDGGQGDTSDMIVGTCWKVNSDTEGTTGKIAVVRQSK